MAKIAYRVLVLVALFCGVHGARAQAAPVAVVNGQAITREDIDREDARPESAKMVLDGNTKTDSLMSLIARALFAQAAVRDGASRLPLVDAEIRKALPFPSEKLVLPGTAAVDAMTPEEKANFQAAEQVLAQVYIDLKLYDMPKIEDSDIHEFYEQSPHLFSKRRVYTFQELAVDDASPQVIDWVKANIRSANGLKAVTDYLDRNGAKFRSRVAVRSAEEMPLQALNIFGAMRKGDVVDSKSANARQFTAVMLQATLDAPRSEPEVTDMIRAYLHNRRRTELMATEYGLLKLKGDVTISP